VWDICARVSVRVRVLVHFDWTGSRKPGLSTADSRTRHNPHIRPSTALHSFRGRRSPAPQPHGLARMTRAPPHPRSSRAMTARTAHAHSLTRIAGCVASSRVASSRGSPAAPRRHKGAYGVAGSTLRGVRVERRSAFLVLTFPVPMPPCFHLCAMPA